MAGSLRLALELALADNASGGLRQVSDSLRTMGAEGEAAAAKVTASLAKIEQGRANLARAQEWAQTLKPMIEGAARLEDVLASYRVEIDADGADETIARLTAEAARIAGPTQFSVAQVASISLELQKAGLKQSDILGKGGAAEATAKLATADKALSQEDAQRAMISGGNIFGLDGSEFAGFADLMTRASSAGATSVTDITAALENAQAAGKLDAREVLGSLALVSNSGLGGAEAGTALQSMLNIGAAKSSKDKRVKNIMFDENGDFRELSEMADKLQEVTAKMTEQQKAVFLNESFGEGGKFAGLLAGGGLEEVLAGMENSRSLDERVAVLGSTFSARVDALSGSAETLATNVFTPALGPLGQLAEVTNELVGWLSQVVAQSPALAKTVSAVAVGGVGLAGALGVARMASGGLGVLGGLRAALSGQGGMVGGLLGAKAAEAAGIQPVFVTNWPSGALPTLGGTAASTVASTATSTATASAAAGAAGLRAAINGSKAATAINGLLLAGGAKAAAAGLGGAAVAGAAGYGVGTVINEKVLSDDTKLGLQGFMAKVTLAGDSLMKLVGFEGMSQSDRKLLGDTKTFAPEIKVDVKVDAQGGATATVRTGAATAQAVQRGGV
ncbi:phage tail tape measure protein [Myxococcota bacterium]|nr:phage tail tape measure protein [Myxococcota bacterium]